MNRREVLLDTVTDHVMERGLIDLTLRPLAAAIGTSDRMLIYHFGSRDALVSAVVARSGERSSAALHDLEPARGVRAGVRRLWVAYQEEPLRSCTSIYLQASATGLIGREPYLSDVRASNEEWTRALSDYLVRCGAPPRRVGRIVALVDPALFGFFLDLLTDTAQELARGVDDLARAAQAMADGDR